MSCHHLPAHTERHSLSSGRRHPRADHPRGPTSAGLTTPEPPNAAVCPGPSSGERDPGSPLPGHAPRGQSPQSAPRPRQEAAAGGRPQPLAPPRPRPETPPRGGGVALRLDVAGLATQRRSPSFRALRWEPLLSAPASQAADKAGDLPSVTGWTGDRHSLCLPCPAWTRAGPVGLARPPQAPRAGTDKGPRKCLRSETILKYFRHLNTLFGEFPGSPAVTTSVSNARDAGSIPGQKAKTPHVSTPKKTKHKTETSLEQIQ